MSTTENFNHIEHLLSRLLIHFGYQVDANLSLTEKLGLIRRHDRSIADLIANYYEAVHLYQFICNDIELKIKAPEIWTIQSESAEEQVEIYQNQVLDKLSSIIS